MLHLRLRVPSELADRVVGLLTGDDTVTNVAVVDGAYAKPPGCLVTADVAREGANPVVAALRALDLHHSGSIMVSEPTMLLSDAADAAEKAAPGLPDDGIVWDVVENRVRSESRLSWSFCSFLTLATLIAGTGRLLDQPILIIGAMVVGPEFSPVAAICVALARPRPSLLPQAVRTLVGGFAIAVAVAAPMWWLAHLLGLATRSDAASGTSTDFIISPDIWSFLIALLAGVAGVLALTTSKSGPLVGVWSEIPGALVQLGVNLTGMVLAGTLTLLVQRVVWSRIQGSSRLAGFRG